MALLEIGVLLAVLLVLPAWMLIREALGREEAVYPGQYLYPRLTNRRFVFATTGFSASVTMLFGALPAIAFHYGPAFGLAIAVLCGIAVFRGVSLWLNDSVSAYFRDHAEPANTPTLLRYLHDHFGNAASLAILLKGSLWFCAIVEMGFFLLWLEWLVSNTLGITPLLALVVAATLAIYMRLSGYRAVIRTDELQFVMAFAAAFAIGLLTAAILVVDPPTGTVAPDRDDPVWFLVATALALGLALFARVIGGADMWMRVYLWHQTTAVSGGEARHRLRWAGLSAILITLLALVPVALVLGADSGLTATNDTTATDPYRSALTSFVVALGFIDTNGAVFGPLAVGSICLLVALLIAAALSTLDTLFMSILQIDEDLGRLQGRPLDRQSAQRRAFGRPLQLMLVLLAATAMLDLPLGAFVIQGLLILYGPLFGVLATLVVVRRYEVRFFAGRAGRAATVSIFVMTASFLGVLAAGAVHQPLMTIGDAFDHVGQWIAAVIFTQALFVVLLVVFGRSRPPGGAALLATR